MQFQLYSDIHLEMFNGHKFPKITPKADYLILAGNIDRKNLENFLDYTSKNWERVFYVLGNHEYYYSSYTFHLLKDKYKNLCNKFHNVHLCDNSYHIIDDIIIYGFTAWTKPIFKTSEEACLELNDYNEIRTFHDRTITIGEIAIISDNDMIKFKQFLEFFYNFKSFKDKKLMIVTHFPPISGSSDNLNTTSDPIYKNDILQNYFRWNNLCKEECIPKQYIEKIKVWCSGHTHWNFNFVENNIQYISNQIGYIEETIQFNDGLFTV